MSNSALKFLFRVGTILQLIAILFFALSVSDLMPHNQLNGLLTVLSILLIYVPALLSLVMLVIAPLNYSWIKELSRNPAPGSRPLIVLHVVGIILTLLMAYFTIGAYLTGLR